MKLTGEQRKQIAIGVLKEINTFEIRNLKKSILNGDLNYIVRQGGSVADISSMVDSLQNVSSTDYHLEDIVIEEVI